MTGKLKLRQPGTSIIVRVFSLGVLLVGLAGLAVGEMSPFEAGRLYLVALGMYLMAPAENLPRNQRQAAILLRQPRYLIGSVAITVAIGLVILQSVAGVI